MSGPTLIMSAIPQELALLRRQLADASEVGLHGRRVVIGILDDNRVVLAEAGIGKVNAAVVVTRLVDRFAPEMVLFTGVAGGLDPDLRVGDVVVGERTIHHDAGVIEAGRLVVHQAGHVPFFNPSDRLGYSPSADVLAAAQRAIDDVELTPLSSSAGGIGAPPRVVLGTILTGDQFINDAATRERLREELGGSAVEMEGAAVAQACEEMGVECLVVRALSDLAGSDSHLDFVRFLDAVALNSAAVIRTLLDQL